MHFPVPVAESCVKPVTFISACRRLASSSSSQVPRFVQVPAERGKFIINEMGRFSNDLRLSLMRILTVNCCTADSLGLKMFEDFMWHRLQVPTFQVTV